MYGAGAAGSSAAYHLQKFADEDRLDIDVTVYERNSYIGGRSTTVDVHGDPRESVELGASHFFPSSRILTRSSEQLGLRTREVEALDNDVTAIWNGQKFIYTQKRKQWESWAVTKLLAKYGKSPLHATILAKNVLSHFTQLYNSPFTSLSDRARQLEITPATFATAEDLLRDHRIKDSFARDVIQASTRINSGMNLDNIHGLQAIYSMTPEEPVQIEGGNWRLFDRMLTASNAKTFVNKTVTTITRSEAEFTEFIITSTYKNAANEEISEAAGPFDAVILTGPIQYANIHIGAGLLRTAPEHIPYATLHVTLFTSSKSMSPAFFGLGRKAKVPTNIVTTLPPGERIVNMEEGVGSPGFFGITVVREVTNPETSAKEYLYKIYTPKKVTAEFLADLFALDRNTDRELHGRAIPPCPTQY
ncbi:FAD/NAD(P)-binding protein [Diplocarpon rosae]|nr:FAD/NAD(P)-binding protein [Diplocarpon rosae]